jgi:hypothetical protein
MLRHFLAALAYRTQKALRGAPKEFETFEAGNQVKTPKELLRHMSSVMGYARTFFIGRPFSDAMTHAGQLAMLRRLVGAPVAPENFVYADVRADRLGTGQPQPAAPDSEWPEPL